MVAVKRKYQRKVAAPEQGVAATLQQRGNTHGDYEQNAFVSQRIKDILRVAPNWENLQDIQKQSLELFADKISRILVGDPDFADHWHDISGYAKLVEDRLPQE